MTIIQHFQKSMFYTTKCNCYVEIYPLWTVDLASAFRSHFRIDGKAKQIRKYVKFTHVSQTQSQQHINLELVLLIQAIHLQSLATDCS